MVSGEESIHEAVAEYTFTVSGSRHTRKQINSLDAVIYMQESLPQTRFIVFCSSPVMRLAPSTSPRFAVDARNICLVGENPMCSVPAL